MNVYLSTERQDHFSAYVDDLKLARKTENIDKIWKVLMKIVDLVEPISFLDYAYLGDTLRVSNW